VVQTRVARELLDPLRAELNNAISVKDVEIGELKRVADSRSNYNIPTNRLSI